MLRFFGAPACAVVMLMLAPAVAGADSYTVTSCHDPLGRSNAAAGWASSVSGTGWVANGCATPNGGLAAALMTANPPGNSSANWRFNAPTGTRIVRVMARRTTLGFGPSGEAKDIAYVMETNNALLESCEPSQTSSCVGNLIAPLDKQGLSGSHVDFRVLCTNAGSWCTRPVSINGTYMHVHLEDRIAPAISGLRVIDNGETSGRLRVRFDASDIGGGLYRTLINVDGKIFRASTLGGATCTDSGPGDPDPYQFNVPVPCPRAVNNTTTGLDVGDLPPGPHGVEIAVEDAAGNQTTVFGPFEYPKLNAGPTVAGDVQSLINAKLRMWFVKARNRGKRYTSRYGTRVVTRGTLRRSNGRGVQGARIDVYHVRGGKRRLIKTGLKTRRLGRLTLILPNNVDTRTIEYAYRALRPGRITSRVRLRLKVIRNGKVFYRPAKRR